MLLFRKPNNKTIQTFLAQQQQCQLTYDDIGATNATPPAGFNVDHTRVALGSGEPCFDRAQAALRAWEQFRLDWVKPASPEAPIIPDQVVGVLFRVTGCWWLNACRIVYVIDESVPKRRFGFGYGTLPGHVEAGEERFLVEMDDQGQVWYDILAFSRPRHLLARLGKPYARRLQRRFGRESAQRMQRIVAAY